MTTYRKLLAEIKRRGDEPLNDLIMYCAVCDKEMLGSKAIEAEDLSYGDGGKVYVCSEECAIKGKAMAARNYNKLLGYEETK